MYMLCSSSRYPRQEDLTYHVVNLQTEEPRKSGASRRSASKTSGYASNDSVEEATVARRSFSFFGRRKSRDSLGEESEVSHMHRGRRTRRSTVVSADYNIESSLQSDDQQLNAKKHVRSASEACSDGAWSARSGASARSRTGPLQPRQNPGTMAGRAMKRTSWGIPTSVYFDGREVGCISVKPNQIVANIRTMLLADIPQLAQCEFYFWYSKDTTAEEVDLEDENITQITYCLDDTNNLWVASKEYMKSCELVVEMTVSGHSDPYDLCNLKVCTCMLCSSSRHPRQKSSPIVLSTCRRRNPGSQFRPGGLRPRAAVTLRTIVLRKRWLLVSALASLGGGRVVTP